MVLFFPNMIIVIIIIIITSWGEVARVALNVYKTNMQLTGVLSPVEFLIMYIYTGGWAPGFSGTNFAFFLCGKFSPVSAMNKASFQVIVELRGVFMWQNSSPSYRDLCRLYLWTQQCFSKERAVDVKTELIWTGSKNTVCSFLFQVSQIRQVSHSLTLQQEKVTWLVSRLLSIMTLTSLFQTKMADLLPTMHTQPVKPVVPGIWWWKNHAGYFPCE